MDLGAPNSTTVAPDWNSGLLAARPRSPLRVKTSPVVERFLRAYAGCGEAGIEVGASQGFTLCKSFTKKDGEAADESIARTCTVDRCHRKCREVLDPIVPGQQ